MSNRFLDIMALGMFFIYQLEILKYATQILVDGKTSGLKNYILAFINCVLLVVSIVLPIRHEFIYGFTMLVLAVEFKLISKAGWLQVFCGSSIFAMNIASVIIPVVAVMGHLTNTAPADIFQSAQYRGITLFVSCFLLSVVVLPVVKSFFSLASVRNITKAGNYSLLLFISVLGTVLYESLFVATIFTGTQYSTQLTLAIFTSVFVLTSFYYFFGYSCSLLNASFYQKESDALIDEKEHLESTKTVLSEKIERDALTGTNNRRFIISFLQDLIDSKTAGFTVLFVDINALKSTNDHYGHAAGDRLICRVAKVLSTVVRENDAVARVGGDEFVVVLTNAQPQTAEKILVRIQACLEQEDLEEVFPVSASIGALYVDSELQQKSVDYILSKVDEKMRENKKQFYA